MVSLLEDAQDLPNSNENTGATQQAHMPFCCRSLFGCDAMWFECLVRVILAQNMALRCGGGYVTCEDPAGSCL